MHIAVEMLFDQASAHSLQEMSGELQKRYGLQDSDYSAPPHIRLAALESEPAFLRSTVQGLAYRAKPLRLSLDTVATFPQGVVYLAPSDTGPLRSLHAGLHHALTEHGIHGNPHYEPRVWQPHCTVAVGISQGGLAEALESCRKMLPSLPTVSIDCLAVLAYRPFRELYRYSLGH